MEGTTCTATVECKIDPFERPSNNERNHKYTNYAHEQNGIETPSFNQLSTTFPPTRTPVLKSEDILIDTQVQEAKKKEAQPQLWDT